MFKVVQMTTFDPDNAHTYPKKAIEYLESDDFADRWYDSSEYILQTKDGWRTCTSIEVQKDTDAKSGYHITFYRGDFDVRPNDVLAYGRLNETV